MSFTFEIRKSINVMLFILKSLGGSADVFTLFAVMYLSELKHLAKHGSLITGDNYIAMKNGPVPYNMYSVYQQLKGRGYLRNLAGNFKEYIAAGNNETIVAVTDYSEDYISRSEANCLFDTIREFKNESADQLKRKTMDIAWEKASLSNDMSIENMAVAAGASTEMIAYIQHSFANEILLFNENDAPGS
jgi:hypothetical protein